MFDAIAKPFGVLLMLLYDFCDNYGVAIILFAVIVKIIMLPFQMKSKRGTMQQQRLQPRVKEIEKKHGANKQKMQQEVMELYREEGVNQFSGCLWSIIPLPILLSLFQAIRNPLTIMMGVAKELLEEGGAILVKLTEMGFDSAKSAYAQIAQAQFISSSPENLNIFQQISSAIKSIDYTFLGLDLGATPQWKVWTLTSGAEWLLLLIPLASAGLSFVQSTIAQKNMPAPDPDNPAASQSKMMMYMAPIMSLGFGFAMPAALSLYWGFGTILDIGREVWLNKRYTRIFDAEDIIKNESRRIKEAELERKRAETERLRAENKTIANPNTSKKKQEAAERAEREARAAEYERANSDAPEAPLDPAREGSRRHARGRAYNPERYGTTDTELVAEEESSEAAEPDATEVAED